MKQLSICIPRLKSFIYYTNVKTCFEKLNIGTIERIDIVNNKLSRTKKAFIHLSELNDTENETKIYKLLNEKKSFKLVYSFPWFWKCYLSELPKDK